MSCWPFPKYVISQQDGPISYERSSGENNTCVFSVANIHSSKGMGASAF